MKHMTLKLSIASLGLVLLAGCQVYPSELLSHTSISQGSSLDTSQGTSRSSHIVSRRTLGYLGARLPRIESVKTISEKGIFMQQHDYSCGAASLATLLHFYFGEDIDELSLLEYMKTLFSDVEQRQIEEDGLSFLELTRIATSLGYRSASLHLPVASLDQVDRPVIVYVERDDYRHFAVYKGLVEDRVLLADPSRGNIRISILQFMGEWDGRTFIMEKPGFVPSDNHALAVHNYKPLRNELISLRSRLNQRLPIHLPPAVLGRRVP